MTAIQAMPTRNPANSGLAGAFREIMGKMVQNMDGCLPAIVEAYDRASNVARVRPAIKAIANDGTEVPRAPVASVPVLALGGGEFFINFPIKPGDKGWIYACDRDISLFKQGLAEDKPNTFRKKSFEDGIFIPDILRDYTIDAEDMDGNLVVQHKGGKHRIAVWPNQVKITCKETSFTVKDDGSIEGVAPVGMKFDTPMVEFTGTFTSGTGGQHGASGGASKINGSLHATKNVSSDTDVLSNGVSGYNHVHTGVQPGGGTSADPVK